MRSLLLVMKLLVVNMLLLKVQGVYAQAASGVAFLKVGIDAVGLAMGGTGVAYARGPFASYWNPAGLATQEEWQAGGSYHIWVENVRSYSMAFAGSMQSNLRLGGFVTTTTLGIDELDVYGYFLGINFVTLGGSVAYGEKAWAVGANFRFISERVLDENATGLSGDLGVQVEVVPGVRLGGAVQQIGWLERIEGISSTLPRTIRVGMRVIPLQVVTGQDETSILQLIWALDVTHRPMEGAPLWGKGRQQLRTGVALIVFDLVHLRGGYLSSDPLRRWSLGGGLSWSNLEINYAYLPFRIGFGNSGHVLTMTYFW